MLPHRDKMARGMSENSYDIRRSVRARRFCARVHQDGRVEIVVPRAAPSALVHDFIVRHQPWIERRVAHFRARYVPEVFPPPTLELPALARRWSIATVATAAAKSLIVEREPSLLELQHVTLADRDAIRALLREWLRGVIRKPFEDRLGALAQAHGFDYRNMQLRWQRSRWGSCSRRGVISLNACAAFQRAEVLDYLMIHELAHTQHMNHSAAYWARVARSCPDWRELDRELRHGWQRVPQWIFR